MNSLLYNFLVNQESKDRVRLQEIKEQVRQHFLTVKIEQSFTVKPNLTK